jgi:DNA-binding response OmpR family regulator
MVPSMAPRERAVKIERHDTAGREGQGAITGSLSLPPHDRAGPLLGSSLGASVAHADPPRDRGEAPSWVLIVEDDPALRSILADLLTDEGYHTLASGDGEEALSLARSHQPRLALVLLDLILPGVSGVHVLHRLRQESDVPVLVVSARAEEQDVIDCLDLGADGYVVKPFGLHELLARIRAAIRRGAGTTMRRSPLLRRGTLVIEPDTERVRLADQLVALGRRETKLLLTLALEPGRAFSRRELLREVWEREETDASKDLVDVTVFRLRRKLERAGLVHPVIQAIPGRGYRFAALPDFTLPPDTATPLAHPTPRR